MIHLFDKLRPRTHLSRLVFYCFLLILLYAVPLHAQSLPPSGQVVLKATDHLALYRVDSDGQLTLIANLPNTIGMEYTANAEWNIPGWKQVVMSPNEAYVAFVAYDSQSKTALFVADISSGNLKQVNLPKGFGAIHWSPNSDGIVLAPFEEYYNSALELNSIYRYDLLSDTLIELVNEANISNGSILWLPDNQRVVYVGSFVSCERPCVGAANLFVIDRNGGTSAALTNLATEIPAHTTTSYDSCYPKKLIWNDTSQRIYYTLNCADAIDRRLDMVYSVRLNQDNRFEGDLSLAFPHDSISTILTITPVGNKIYIAVDAESTPYLYGGDITEEVYGAVRALRLDQPGTLTITNDLHYDINLIRSVVHAEMSPDHNFWAFVGFNEANKNKGYLRVVVVNNGQVVNEQQPPNQICNIEWLDNQKVIYTEFPESQCNPYTEPGDTIIYDTQTGSDQILNHAGEMMWLLSPP